VADCWRGVLTNPGDVKELIPQFYATEDNATGGRPGRFLTNSDNLDLGVSCVLVCSVHVRAPCVVCLVCGLSSRTRLVSRVGSAPGKNGARWLLVHFRLRIGD
jgi:hypothetical protein